MDINSRVMGQATILRILWGVIHAAGATVTGVQMICKWEAFNATCGPGEVMLVEQAMYGRMQLGRCVTRDYGYIGCNANVRDYLDRRCSGRPSCQLSLPDEVLDNTPRQCPDDLGAYLEVEHKCLQVTQPSEQRCHNYLEAPLPTGYISNHLTLDRGFGSIGCPWRITGGKGQKVTITLLDFAVFREDGAGGPPEKSGICHIYAQIREHKTKSSITLCGGEARERVVYTSESNAVEVEVVNNRASEPTFFLLKYEVSGCPDFTPHANALAERTGNTVSVRCANSDVTWHLTCKDEKWVGHVENCTDSEEWNIAELIENTISMPQGVLIIVIIAIAVFIAIIILIIGILTLKRRSPVSHPTEEEIAHYNSMQQKYIRDGVGSIGGGGGGYYGPPGKEQYPMLSKDHPGATRESDYTTTLHRRLAVPPPPAMMNGVFPDLPSPPPPGELCPVHGSYGDGCMSTGAGHPVFRPPQIEHIYESPKFERKRPRDSPFYHELEPTSNSDPSDTDSHLDLTPPDPTQLPKGLKHK